MLEVSELKPRHFYKVRTRCWLCLFRKENDHYCMIPNQWMQQGDIFFVVSNEESWRSTIANPRRLVHIIFQDMIMYLELGIGERRYFHELTPDEPGER